MRRRFERSVLGAHGDQLLGLGDPGQEILPAGGSLCHARVQTIDDVVKRPATRGRRMKPFSVVVITSLGALKPVGLLLWRRETRCRFCSGAFSLLTFDIQRLLSKKFQDTTRE